MLKNIVVFTMIQNQPKMKFLLKSTKVIDKFFLSRLAILPPHFLLAFSCCCPWKVCYYVT
jgi:hypothetical protein